MNLTQVRKRYKEVLRSYKLRPQQAILSAGAALVVYGIREDTSDLDLDTDHRVITRMKSEPEAILTMFNGGLVVEIPPDLSFHPYAVPFSDCLMAFGGVAVYTLEALLRQKRRLLESPERNPAKLDNDRADIRAIEKRLKLR